MKNWVFNPTWVLAVFMGAWLTASSAQAASVVAKKKSVKVYATASKKGDVLATLDKGDAIEAIERQGMYWQVKTSSGKTGYVSVLTVKHQPDSDTSLSKAIQNAARQGRTSDDSGSVRSRSAVMGVRGAAEDEEVEFAGNVRPDLRAVFFMEDYKVSEQDIEALEERVFAEIESKSGT